MFEVAASFQIGCRWCRRAHQAGKILRRFVCWPQPVIFFGVPLFSGDTLLRFCVILAPERNGATRRANGGRTRILVTAVLFCHEIAFECAQRYDGTKKRGQMDNRKPGQEGTLSGSQDKTASAQANNRTFF